MEDDLCTPKECEKELRISGTGTPFWVLFVVLLIPEGLRFASTPGYFLATRWVAERQMPDDS